MIPDLIDALQLPVAIVEQDTLTPVALSEQFVALVGKDKSSILTMLQKSNRRFTDKNLINALPYKTCAQLKIGRTKKAIEFTISEYIDGTWLISGKDVTELKKMEFSLSSYSRLMEAQEKKLYEMAYTDVLTGIPNRRALFERIDKRDATVTSYAICILDLDYFKTFNDRFGHEFGDHVLISFTQKISKSLTDEGYFARIGGEEFCILSFVQSGEELRNEVDRILDSVVSEGIDMSAEKTNVSFSAGTAEYPKDGVTIDELLSNADKALYYAKENGRSRIVAFAPELSGDLQKISTSQFRER